MEYAALVQRYAQAKAEVLGGKPVLVPATLSTTTLHGLPWDQIRVSEVRGTLR